MNRILWKIIYSYNVTDASERSHEKQLVYDTKGRLPLILFSKYFERRVRINNMKFKG